MPRSCGLSGRVVELALRHYIQEKRHVGQLRQERRNARLERNASKGESHERCECAIKLARVQREKTVMRVIKP